MEIWHDGDLRDKRAAQIWESRGLALTPVKRSDGSEPKRWQFRIRESDPLWPELRAILKGAHTYLVTEFTQDEILSAQWCIAREEYSIGSFVPHEKWWTPIYFADRCRTCGTGWRQIAPFRIAKEPKLEDKSFAGFGSAFELFATPEVLKIFQQHRIDGFEGWPLILDKEDRPANSLKQIIVTEMAEPAIAEELVERERYYEADCPTCRRTWHLYYTRGMLPLRKSALNAKADFQLTHEWFGNGRAARHEILVSQRVVELAFENRWQGIHFVPIQVV